MSSSSRERRQEAAKRQIMGNLVLQDESNMPAVADGYVAAVSSSTSRQKASRQFVLDKDVDGTKPDQVQFMLDDLKKQMLDRQQVLATEAQTGKQQQTDAYFSGMFMVSKSFKKMTVRDFNKTHNCNLLELLSTTYVGNKKRPLKAMETQTPAPTTMRRGKAAATPSRTVARGEAIFSKNGSPVDTVEEGTLVATVSKKRRGKASAVFDISVGEGRYINLQDPACVKYLEGDMKDAAISQLKILQDQMASLMAQLKN